MASKRLHHAWLLTGPRGIGKASFADRCARLLLGADREGSVGAKLMGAGSHPDFRRLERQVNDKTGSLARNITVDQVRLLRTLMSTATAMGGRRAILIDGIDDMERGAANALLKMLEEPPAGTIFLLVSHQPGRLLPTIRSRCRTIIFAPLDDAAMTSALAAQHPAMDTDLIAQLIQGANGSPATALAHATLDIVAIDTALAELARSGDPANAVRSTLAQALSVKAALPRYEAFLNRAPAFIADKARRAEGTALGTALTAWEKARSLAQIAIPQSLVAETVVFEMSGYVAALAPRDARAKA